jgi:alpha-galactosidase
MIVDRQRPSPLPRGNLPPELAGYCAPHVFVRILTVQAALKAARPSAQAALLDRHAGSVLSIKEIRTMSTN